MDSIGNSAWKILQYGVECWNKLVNLSISYLSLDMNAAGETISKEGNNIIKALMHFEESIFIPVACMLAVMIYICRLFNESINIKEGYSWEKFAEGIIVVSISQALIINCRAIITALFQVGVNIISYMSKGTSDILSSLTVTLDEGWGEVFVNMDLLPSAFFLIFNFFAFIIIFASGIVLLFTVIMRFFKIFIMMPIGILSYATTVGGREISASAKAYTKYVILCIVEGILIVLALQISAQWNGLGLEQLGLTESKFVTYSSYGVDMSCSGGIIEGIVAILDVVVPILGTVTIVKMSQNLISKAFAL